MRKKGLESADNDYDMFKVNLVFFSVIYKIRNIYSKKPVVSICSFVNAH